MKTDSQIRTYNRYECAVFSKTKEAYGGLSNMAAGFPLLVNGVRIRTSEALYQACRYPHLPEIQRQIINDVSPMTAKMKTKPYRKDSRPDWDRVRVKIMRWCLRVKLAQNWDKFSQLLLVTLDKPIVELSSKDDFWGAKVVDEDTLVGMNVLGRLLMELREEIKQGDREQFSRVDPLDIPDFLLYGGPILPVVAQQTKGSEPQPMLFNAIDIESPANRKSLTLFDALGPYPKYQTTGIPWLGKVPVNWKIERTKWLFRHKKEINSSRANKNILSLTLRGVVNNDPSNPEGLVPKDYATYQLFEKDDLVFKLIDLENIRTSRVGLVHENGIMSSAYVRLIKRNEGETRFFYHQFYDLYARGVFNQLGAGVRSTLGPADLLNISILVPPIDEQAMIVRFLDHVYQRIERTILAKRKVIALLNEQKQTITHHAVTRGLDPNVRLKSSEITWLGEIPTHWEVRRIKYLLREVDCRSTTGSETLLSMRMHHGLVVFADHFTRPPQAATLVGFKIVQPGQFVVNRMQAGNGVIFPSTLKGLVSPDYAVFSPIADVNVDFLGELFRSRTVRAKFRAESKGLGTGTSGFLRLYNDRLGAIHVALPPRAEQDSILVGLGEQLKDVNDVIDRTEREISLLREYRTRIIADVVTGKLDVREAAHNLPEDLEVEDLVSEEDRVFDEDDEELMEANNE